jgi:hypothetical protein
MRHLNYSIAAISLLQVLASRDLDGITTVIRHYLKRIFSVNSIIIGSEKVDILLRWFLSQNVPLKLCTAL